MTTTAAILRAAADLYQRGITCPTRAVKLASGLPGDADPPLCCMATPTPAEHEADHTAAAEALLLLDIRLGITPGRTDLDTRAKREEAVYFRGGHTALLAAAIQAEAATTP